MEEIVVLYSGGTDSTCTAALMAEKFNKVHLITYKRFGLFSVVNSSLNVKKLENKFGEDKFVYRLIKLDKLFKKVSYTQYLKNIIKYRFFLLSTCGLCKLAMHIRTLVYCLDNNIKHVCDGASKGMRFFPAQMQGVIEEIKNLYKRYGITYSTPVFDLDSPQHNGFIDRLHLEEFSSDEEKIREDNKITSGKILFEKGLMPAKDVKGTDLDHKMQPRCFQFILFNIFVHWYYLSSNPYEEYEKKIVDFYKEKIREFDKLIAQYLEESKKSKLKKLLEY